MAASRAPAPRRPRRRAHTAIATGLRAATFALATTIGAPFGLYGADLWIFFTPKALRKSAIRFAVHVEPDFGRLLEASIVDADGARERIVFSNERMTF